MIKAMTEREQTFAPPPGEQPDKPLVMIPVMAEDVERRKRKIVLACIVCAAALSGAAWLIYQRINDPVEARQSYDAGVRLMRATRYEEAILNFDRTIQIRPEAFDAYLVRARTYVLQTKPEQAIADYTRAAEMRPADPAVLVERGFAYLGKRDATRALADAEHALKLNGQLAQAYSLRAAAERVTGNWTKAIDDYTEAIKFDARLEYYVQRASTYQSLGRHALALADFNRALEFEPGQPTFYFARAQSRAALGDIEGSKKDILTGRKIDGW